MIEKGLKILILLSLALLLCFPLSSCKTSRLGKVAAKKEKKQEQKERKIRLKAYDKRYRHQTKIQSEQQRKMIIKSRKKPKNMKRKSSFFMFRKGGLS